LQDRSSQPNRLLRSHELRLVVEAIGRLHGREPKANWSMDACDSGRRRRDQADVRIGSQLGVPMPAVGFWQHKAETAWPTSLREKEPPNRYEHEARAETQPHPALSTEDQWQGRPPDPDRFA